MFSATIIDEGRNKQTSVMINSTYIYIIRNNYVHCNYIIKVSSVKIRLYCWKKIEEKNSDEVGMLRCFLQKKKFATKTLFSLNSIYYIARLSIRHIYTPRSICIYTISYIKILYIMYIFTINRIILKLTIIQGWKLVCKRFHSHHSRSIGFAYSVFLFFILFFPIDNFDPASRWVTIQKI